MVSFFEAFPDLSVEDKVYDFFGSAQVEKISASKTKMLAFIYCRCDRFLSLRMIRNMEKTLYKQVFRRLGIRPRLEVSYPFAQSYSLTEIMEQYEDTLKEEMREFDSVNYMKFCRKPFRVEDDTLQVFCEDDFLCHEHSKQVEDFLLLRLHKRFGKEAAVSFVYEEKKQKKKEEPEVYHMVVKKEALAENTTNPAAVKKPFVPKKSNYRKPAKDPTVFYGKNVEGEVLPIKEIIDEIGEVVVEGMIRQVEEREIKGEKLLVSFAITDFTDTIIAKIFIKKFSHTH